MAANKNTIKGLTIEIGGDTTKLGKALEDVNKKSRDLSSELGQINKLLKLDPGNADLLAQKQKVLADAVANTQKKLQTLKEAEKQVQKQFERGEVSEAQVRELRREIISSEAALSRYEVAVRETAAAVDALGDESEDSARKTAKGADSMGDYDDATSKADKSSGGLGKTLAGGLKAGFAAAAAAAAALVGALVAAAESTREYRTEMGKLDTAFTANGHSSEAAQKTYKELQGILGETDQAVEAANHLALLAENEEDLAKWTNIATGVYATFGASLPIENLTEASNETAKTGQLTGGLADALNWAGVSEEKFQAQLDACTSEQERQALITDTLNGLYTEAADKYRETNAEIIRANQATEAWTQSLAGAGAAVEPLLTDVKMLGADLLSSFLPAITDLTTAFRGLLNGDEGAADAIGEALSNIITQLFQKIEALAPTVVQVATSLITELVTTLITMLPQLVTTGVTLVTTVLNGLTSALPLVAQAFADMVPQLVSALETGIPQLLQAAVALLMAVVDAVGVILPPLIEALPSIIMTLVNGLMEAIPQLLQAALQLLMTLVQAIPLLLEALLPELGTIISTILTGLLDSLPLLIDAAYTLFFAIVEAIPKICLQLIKALPQIWTSIYSVLKTLPSRFWALLTQVINKVVEWGKSLGAKAKEAAQKLWDAIVDKIKGLPEEMKETGKNLVEGLWNGIKNMANWVKKKIKGFADDVLEGIKDFFGIHSPSTETEWMGKMLDEGMARGIAKNASAPIDEMDRLASEMLDQDDTFNGLTLERRVNATFGQDAAAEAAYGGLFSKLDRILEAIQNGHIIALDGKALVGATIDQYDDAFGLRAELAARGAR